MSKCEQEIRVQQIIFPSIFRVSANSEASSRFANTAWIEDPAVCLVSIPRSFSGLINRFAETERAPRVVGRIYILY